MSPSVCNLVALVCVPGILLGIRLMSSPRTAILGNLLGAMCMAVAVVLALVANDIVGHQLLWLSMAVGGVVGYFMATKATMTQIPQLVALLNGLGGAASASVAFVVVMSGYATMARIPRFAGGLALVLGAVTLSGSVIAAAKLHQKMRQRPIVLTAHGALTTLGAVVAGVLILTAVMAPSGLLPVIASLCLPVGLSVGVLVAIRIGGADMPITISLFNSLSGVAASITGFVIGNVLLVAVGAIVGSAGLILTHLMCGAMNRTLVQVLTGRTVSASGRGTGAAREAGETLAEGTRAAQTAQQRPRGRDAASILGEADRIVIVPGYGMALSQAQQQVKELFDKLQAQGKDVTFAIHPVAGRMPGHMNVLLAEVGVPYDKLSQMDDFSNGFSDVDVVVVVGANDVVNAAADTAEGTPIYGMPVFRVQEARHVIVCNKDMGPGYAGVDNPLYEQPNAILVLGDAAETVKGLSDQLHGPN